MVKGARTVEVRAQMNDHPADHSPAPMGAHHFGSKDIHSVPDVKIDLIVSTVQLQMLWLCSDSRHLAAFALHRMRVLEWRHHAACAPSTLALNHESSPQAHSTYRRKGAR